MAGVVDTSVLYACLSAADPEHMRAQALLTKHSGVEIPPAIYSELELLVRKKAGLATARRVLPRFLKENPHVSIMDADLHPAALDIWQRHGRLSYADAQCIAAALKLGGALITLDARQSGVWKKEAGKRRA